MNAIDPTPRRGTPFDLDGLLQSFFHAEMPRPWPHWQVPAFSREPSMSLRRRSLARSRVALAAGLLILLTGYAGLAGRVADPASGFEPSSQRWESARRTRAIHPRKSFDPAQRPHRADDEGWLPERR